jgi:predicted nucleic acid-binding protein
VKCRPYHTHRTVQPIQLGKPAELRIETWPSSTLFEAGSELVVEIVGHDADRYPALRHESASRWPTRWVKCQPWQIRGGRHSDVRRTGLHVTSACESTGVTTFVIDAQAAIDLAISGATIPPEHSLAAPTLLRSQALALVYESVRRGEIDERTGRKVLDDIRGLRIRLLGDRSLQDHAWRIATKLNWPDTYQAEYIALTQLQADALATADRKLAVAARTFVETVSPADILRP